MRSFVKIKSSRNGEITLSFTDIGKSYPSRDFLMSQICFNAIRENKILAKISEFTVYHVTGEFSNLRYSFTIKTECLR